MISELRIICISALLATVLAAPPLQSEKESPLAAIGNFIQRLQNSFAEGSAFIGQPQGNQYSLPQSAPFPKPFLITTSSTTTPPTTTTKRVTNAFDSINAILDNISRSSKTNQDVDNNKIDGNYYNNKNDIFANVPGRSFNVPPTTPKPFFSLTTTQSPFGLDGIHQGINAFFQTVIKHNVAKLFQPKQDYNSQARRSDEPTTYQAKSGFGDFFGSLFRKQQ